MTVAGTGRRSGRGLDERKQHGERLFGLHGVTEVRWHVQESAGLEGLNFAIQAKFAFPGKNLNQRMLR